MLLRREVIDEPSNIAPSLLKGHAHGDSCSADEAADPCKAGAFCIEYQDL